jgi:hypothetical protein
MRKSIKGYIAGFLTAAIIFSGTLAFAETTEMIEAIFGRVQLEVDGEAVEQDTLLYNGTTYVPLRAAAEILGMEVGWNEASQTASLTSPEEPEEEPELILDVPAETGLTPVEKVEDDEPEIVEKKLPFRVGEIDYKLEILPPNIIGTVYMRTYISNHTGYTITSFDIKWFDKESKGTRYLFMKNSEIVDGGVSDDFEGLGPVSGSAGDVEIREITVGFLNEDGERCTLRYDALTQEYTVTGDY